MPLDEILRNSALATGGLLVAAAALAYAWVGRRRLRKDANRRAAAHHPAE
jgi:hypothetical protein